MQYDYGTGRPHAEIVLVPGRPRRGGGKSGSLAGMGRKVTAYAPLGALASLLVVAIHWIVLPPEVPSPAGLGGCALRALRCEHARDQYHSLHKVDDGTWTVDLSVNTSLFGVHALSSWAAPARWVSDFRITKTSRFASPGALPPVICSNPDTDPPVVHRAITVHGCTTSQGCRPLNLRGAVAAQIQIEMALAGDETCCTCP